MSANGRQIRVGCRFVGTHPFRDGSFQEIQRLVGRSLRAVVDLKAQGFPLVGGRLDYVDRQPVAAIVYQRGKHLINVLAWPGVSGNGAVRAFTIRGYNLLTWAEGDLTYWAVSDVNPKDLAALQRLIVQSTAPATPE